MGKVKDMDTKESRLAEDMKSLIDNAFDSNKMDDESPPLLSELLSYGYEHKCADTKQALANVLTLITINTQLYYDRSKTLDTQIRQLVISLPKSGGQELKSALKKVALKDHRTVSNMTFKILQSWLIENGDLHDDENHTVRAESSFRDEEDPDEEEENDDDTNAIHTEWKQDSY